MTSERAAWLVRLDGEEDRRVWDWARGPLPARSLRSVRRPSSHSRSAHIPVQAYSVRMGTTLRLESGLEHDLVRVLDRDPQVAWMVPQPFRLTVAADGGSVTHAPDLLVLHVTGAVTVWDARPVARADERFWRAVSATKSACEQVGWAHRVFHGLNRVTRVNLLWLHGFRHDRHWYGAWAPRIIDLLDQCPDGVSVQAVRGLDDGTGEVVSTLWHLVWTGRVSMDLDRPITGGTIVTLPARGDGRQGR